MYFYYFTNIINELTKRIVYQLNKSRAFWSNKYLHFKYYTVNCWKTNLTKPN